MNDWHVYPLDDVVGHEVDGGDCACGPRLDPVKREDGSMGWMHIHHSIDGRERVEVGA